MASHAQADFYQVEAGFLAGEYPYAPSADEAYAKLRSVLDAGVTCLVDLTEPGEHNLQPYAPQLSDTEQHVRMPIRDVSVPRRDEMARILDLIDAKRTEGEKIYVHCYGGVGRTGTVVGCYMMRHGLATSEDVLSKIAGMRTRTRKVQIESPETAEQKEMVTSWKLGE